MCESPSLVIEKGNMLCKYKSHHISESEKMLIATQCLISTFSLPKVEAVAVLKKKNQFAEGLI